MLRGHARGSANRINKSERGTHQGQCPRFNIELGARGRGSLLWHGALIIYSIYCLERWDSFVFRTRIYIRHTQTARLHDAYTTQHSAFRVNTGPSVVAKSSGVCSLIPRGRVGHDAAHAMRLLPEVRCASSATVFLDASFGWAVAAKKKWSERKFT